MDMIGMGARIRSLRKAQGLTQKQLGIRVGIRDNSISLFEADAREPSATMLVRIAGELHTTPDYLLGVDKRHIIVVDQMEEPDREALRLLAASLTEKYLAGRGRG